MGRILDAYAQRHPDLTRKLLTRAVTFNAKRLIVFLTPGFDYRSGGIMSISTYNRESKTLRDIHRARVILCTVPGEPDLLKYTWFENQDLLLNLESVLKSCRGLDYLLLHMPAYAVNQVLGWLHSTSSTLLRDVKDVHLNILVQNIDNMRGQNVLGLKRFGKVTCTTSHEAYSNLATREALGVPLHRLSVCNGPDQYTVYPYHEKEPLMVVSPDAHPLKEQVLQHLARACPDLTIKIIQDLSYEDYRKLIRRAQWSLTFGEGLDGYFVEPAYSGAIAFAVFNSRFFTPAFSNLENIYPSWESLLDRIAADIRRLDEPVAFTRCWQQTHNLLGELYSTDRFRQNLRQFYRGEYTFP